MFGFRIKRERKAGEPTTMVMWVEVNGQVEQKEVANAGAHLDALEGADKLGEWSSKEEG